MTQEDLYKFHARVFGFPAPRPIFSSKEEPNDATTPAEAFQPEDDGLGYYPDGAKRTLTDDQIAMFRHSEIYSIMRERQVRKENLEAEGGEEFEDVVSQPERAVKASTPSEEGEVQSDGEVKEASATLPEHNTQYEQASRVKNKRKREDTDTNYVHGKKYASRSARGLVRELDSAAVEDQVLDYGEEPSTAPPIAEESKQNDLVALQPAEQDRESQARPPEGKRIWWPTIEAT